MNSKEQKRDPEQNLLNFRVPKLSIKKARAGKKRLKDYGKVLLAKQLLRAVYNNPREKTFKKYFLNEIKTKSNSELSRLKKDSSGSAVSMNEVFGKLNSRLEIVLTAMGGALSNNHARQLINHGKISVNGHIIKQRGYLLKDGDIVASAVNFVSQSTESETKFTGLKSQKGAGNLTQPRRGYPYPGKGDDSLNTLSLKVASLKPKKIPTYLNLNTPIFANLLVNSDLNYGIYYSKSIPDNLPQVSSLGEQSRSTSQSYGLSRRGIYPTRGGNEEDLAKNAGLGWKNTNVKAVKTLLLELKLASADQTNQKNTSLKVKTIYSILYNLVQAYYSRQH